MPASPNRSPNPSARTPLDALCVYAESLAHGRRVVVFGDATTGVPETLVGLGARMVSVCDPDAERVRARSMAGAAPRGLSVRELRLREFDVRDGAFDFALIPDVTMLPDPAGVLAEARRLVGVSGALLVAAPNPDALPDGSAPPDAIDYYGLYDLVALQFAHVRMVGILPFHGVTLAELGEREGSPDVAVDTQLATNDGAPTFFAALASQGDVALDPFAIVQLPEGAASFETTLADKDDRLHAALVRAREADAELALLRERARRSEDELERVLEKNANLHAALRETDSARTNAEERADDAADGATSRDHERAAELGRVNARVRELEAALRASDENGIALDARVRELETERAKREADWARESAHMVADARASDDAAAEGRRDLEARLEERGRAVLSLEEDLRRSARVVADLKANLDEFSALLDAQALDAARRESELVAAEWKYKELQRAGAKSREPSESS
ncbi:MAG: hypothetical protein U0169_19315 [Polyangiaceae bacterium]